jgi:hypothetical protein
VPKNILGHPIHRKALGKVRSIGEWGLRLPTLNTSPGEIGIIISIRRFTGRLSQRCNPFGQRDRLVPGRIIKA